MLLKTALNEFHREQGGRLVEFAGWEMPVMYRGILDEHVYTRQHCSVFDVSHMGRVESGLKPPCRPSRASRYQG